MTQSTTLKDTKLLSIPLSIPGNGISRLKNGTKEDTDNYIVITGILETPKHLFFISLQGLYDKRKPFYGIYDKEKHITYMNDANVGLTDDLTHFMPFYPITCTEEGEYAALLEIGKIDEWMDKNPGIVQEGKLSFYRNQ